MKLNKKRTLAYFVLFFLIISCEGNTDRKYIIENNTGSPINVQAIGKFDSYDNEIEADQSETLFISSQLGGANYVENPGTGINSLIITNSNGDTCTKDYLLQPNWIIHTEETKKIPSNWVHEYKFSLEDDDF